MYIVGIDIAKRKHEAAVIDGEGAVIIKPFSFTNNCSGYNRLLAMLAKAKLPLDEVSFAMEATGHYWLALFTRLQKEGFRVQVINPVQTNSIRSFYIRQAKTDPRDALLIAEVIRFGHFSESTLHLPVKYSLHRLKLKTAVLKLLNLLKQLNLFFRVISMPHFISRNIQIKLILPVSEHMCLDSGALCNFRYYVPFFFHL